MPWLHNLTPLILACAAVAAQVPKQSHEHVSDTEFARVLDDPSRDAWQKPHDVIAALALRPTEVVADIGAGTGYFARRFARHAAKIYAVDVSAKLLETAAKGAPANLITVLAAPDDPKLPPASVDTIFFCDVIHHIPARPAYYAKLRKALKPGGRIVVVDFHKKAQPIGPPPEMKIAQEELEAELRAAGFRKTGSFEFLPYQYFVVFQAGTDSRTDK